MYQRYEEVYQRHRNKGEFSRIREICISISPFVPNNLCFTINILKTIPIMETILQGFVTKDGEPTELTMRIAYFVTGFILACILLITYGLFSTEQVYHFGIYG